MPDVAEDSPFRFGVFQRLRTEPSVRFGGIEQDVYIFNAGFVKLFGVGHNRQAKRAAQPIRLFFPCRSEIRLVGPPGVAAEILRRIFRAEPAVVGFEKIAYIA